MYIFWPIDICKQFTSVGHASQLGYYVHVHVCWSKLSVWESVCVIDQINL